MLSLCPSAYLPAVLRPLLCLAFLVPVPQDWEAEYERLLQRVEQAFHEPYGDPGQLEPYLQWLERKAADRDEVRRLLAEAKAADLQTPGEEELKGWVEKFSQLLRLAQASGENTVNGAVLRFMRVEDPKAPKAKNWQVVISRLQQYGRRIRLKAEETGFTTPEIRGAARCMVNFSIRDVEASPHGFGVYSGREGSLGNRDREGNLALPDRDFDVDCEPRSAFTYTFRGEPDKPTELGLEWIDQVRQEARWWSLSEAEADATELMEEFYEDSMCRAPPNPCDRGHRSYRQLAERYQLPRGVSYNEGFNGTLYGKVETVSSSGREPANGATLTVTSPLDGESWQGETDRDGRYEIQHVLLHRECQPLRITVQHGLDETWDVFFGPLDKPSPGHRHEKDLELTKADLVGQVSASVSSTDLEPRNPRVRRTVFFTVTGTWRYQPDESLGWQESFRPDPLKAHYFYFEEAEDTSVGPDCPARDWKLFARGRLELPVWPEYDNLHPLGRLILRGGGNVSGMIPHYGVGSNGAKQPLQVWGEKRLGHYHPECTQYAPLSREVFFGGFSIRGLLGPRGEMQGSESWTSCVSSSQRDVIGIGIDYVQAALAGQPVGYSPGKADMPCEGTEVRVRAEWRFKRLRK